jgi:hypothetical protein
MDGLNDGLAMDGLPMDASFYDGWRYWMSPLMMDSFQNSNSNADQIQKPNPNPNPESSHPKA